MDGYHKDVIFLVNDDRINFCCDIVNEDSLQFSLSTVYYKHLLWAEGLRFEPRLDQLQPKIAFRLDLG